MELITPDLRAQLLAIARASSDNPSFDPMPVVKWFNPCGPATWLITEIDPEHEDQAYGLCALGVGSPELGDVSVSSLQFIRLLGVALGIERELRWRPDKPLSAYARLAYAAGRILS